MSGLLNQEQKRAVETTEGRLLILAGAGSGKTSVLIQRIAYLIDQKGASPTSILGLTFTNKAALEMRHRLSRWIPSKMAKEVDLLTFHSFAYRLLRKEIHRLGFTNAFSLYDENETKRILEGIVRENLEHEGHLPSINQSFELLKKQRIGTFVPPSASSKKSWHDSLLEELPSLFQLSMRAYNAVDFDGLIELAIQLFENHPDVLEAYQSKYRYIMIDEYQDTNPLQDKLAHLLSKQSNNLCVVGDDDQSIYAFRGAKIEQILTFQHDSLIKLEQNYRSTPTILAAANSVIGHNQSRHEKSLWSEKAAGEKIHIFVADCEITEAEGVILRMLELKEMKKLNWKDFAILYRSNILARPLEIALMNALYKDETNTLLRGIPYHIVQGTEFYERREVKDIIAYLRAINNDLDEPAHIRVMNVPRRGISHEALEKITAFQRERGLPLYPLLIKIANEEISIPQLSSIALKGVKTYVMIVEEAKQSVKIKPPSHMLKHLLDSIDYKKMLKNEVKTEKAEQFKWENVQECIRLLENYEKDQNVEKATLADFMATSFLDEDRYRGENGNNEENKVQLLTFHSSKGLEFPACFLVGLEDHVLPHEKSVSEGGLEEERRLFYVAITRAMRYLTLSMAKTRKKMGQEVQSTPSRFLFEISNDLLKPSIWKHPLSYDS